MMYTTEIVMMVLVAALDIDSSNVPINRPFFSRPLSSQHKTEGAVLPEKYLIVQNPQIAPKIYVAGKINPGSDYRYHGKGDYCWSDLIGNNKRSRTPSESCHLKNLKKIKTKGRYPIKELRSTENLDSPSVYLKPPKITINDYQYYAMRGSPKNQSEKTRIWAADHPKNHKPKEKNVDKNNDDVRPAYIRDHAPEQQTDSTNNAETDDEENKINEKPKNSQAPKDRIEFHLHGHAGPETYMFGFDTGDGENRQYRMEERHENGTITGHYGYIDARGKLRKVRYKASPTLGYEEKHHETNGQEYS